jgi:hypothetical protein
VQSLTRGGQRLEWSYDGFLVTEERATGIAPALSTWLYDTDFRVTAHSVSGAAVSYVYDADSLLTQAGGRGRDGPSPLPAEAAPRTDPSERHYRTGLPPWVLA